MLRGIYTAGMGLLIQQKKMDIVSNNLANVNTSGYKRDSAIFSSFNSVLTKRINDYYTPDNASGEIGNMTLGSDVAQVFTDYSQGTLINSGNNTDLAIDSDDSAFFSVQTGDENETAERYTRDGSFTVDANNKLVTREGYAVLGEQGPIALSSNDFTINNKGEVIQEGEIIDKLKIKSFKDTKNLRKVGENLVAIEGEAEEKNFEGTIMQGSLEASNVNSVREMIDMIEVTRAYEACTKILKVHDETLGRAVSEISALR